MQRLDGMLVNSNKEACLSFARAHKLLLVFTAFIALHPILPGLSQDIPAVPDLPAPANKYYQIFQTRPTPGAVFDRLIDACLQEWELATLKKNLETRAKSPQASIEDQLLFAHFLLRQGDNQQALSAFTRLAQKHARSTEAWFWLAHSAARERDYQQALAALDHLLTVTDSDLDVKRRIDILKLKGRWFIRLGKTEQALATWQSLLKNFASIDVHEDVLELQIREGQLEEATKTATDLIVKTQNNPHRQTASRLRLADIRNLANDRPGSLLALEAALKQSGAGTWLETEILAKTQSLFRRHDDIAPLKEQIEKWSLLFPEKTSLLRLQANLLAELGKKKEAREVFQQIIKKTPGDRITQEQFINFLDKLGDKKHAISQLKHLITSYPQDEELHVSLAELLHADGDAASAAKSVRQYLKLSAAGEYEYLRAAQLMEEFNDQANTQSIYQQMIKQFPDSIDGKTALAAYQYRQGQIQQAMVWWQSIAAAGDGDEVQRIARIMSSRYEHEAAYQLLKSRADENQTDPAYLALLCSKSILLQHQTETVDSVRRLVLLAQDVSSLGNALKLAGNIITEANQNTRTIQELENKQTQRSIQETCLLAELLDGSDRLPQAQDVLSKVAKKDKALAQEQLIRLLVAHKLWSKAATAAEAALKLPKGRRIENIRRLVDFNQQAGQFEQATIWIESWKQLAPQSTRPWLRQADLLMLQGQEEASLALLEKTARKFPDDPGIRDRLAETYVSFGHGAKAEREYLKLYENTDSEDAKLRWAGRLAEVAMSLGRLDHVVELFEKRRHSNPKSAGPLLALTAAYRQTSDYDSVRRYLAEAVRLRPSDLRLQHQWAYAEEQLGDWKTARRIMEKSSRLDLSNRSAQKLAALLIRHGEDDAGLVLLQKVTQAKAKKTANSASRTALPIIDDPISMEQMADTLTGSSHWPQIISLNQPLLENYPDDYRLRYLQALALEENGQYQAAGKRFLEVMAINKELPISRRPLDPVEQAIYSPTGSLFPGKHLFLNPAIPVPAGFSEINWQRHAYFFSYYHWSKKQPQLSTRMGSNLKPAYIIRLPNSLQEVRAFAIFHLRLMASSQNQNQVDLWQQQLESLDVNYPGLLLANPIVPAPWLLPASIPIPETETEDPGLLAEWLIRLALFDKPPSGGMTRLKAAYLLFKKDYPDLAFIAAITALSIDDPSQKKDAARFFRDGVKASLPDLSSPSNMVLIKLTPFYQALSPIKGQRWLEENPQTFQLIRKQTSKWLEKMPVDDPLRPHLFSLHALILWQTGKPAAFVALLENEIHRFQNEAKKATLPASWRFMELYGTTAATVSRFEFPPATLPDFPLSVLALFDPPNRARVTRSETNSNPTLHALTLNSFTDLNREDRQQLAALISNRSLRILASRWLEAPSILKDEMQWIANNPETASKDEQLLLAAYYYKQKKFNQTHSLFEKMRPKLPRDWQDHIDSATIALAIDDNRVTPAITTAALQAGSRLKLSGLAPHEKSELSAALLELGLPNKNPQLSATKRQQAKPQKSPFAMGTGIRKRIEGLQQDQPDKAVQLALLRLHRYTQGYYRQKFGTGTAKSFASMLGEIELTSDVLNAAKPKIKANANDWARFAAASYFLGDHPTHIAALQKAIRLSPNTDQATIMRAHLVWITAKNNPSVAKEILEQSPQNPIVFSGILLNRWGNSWQNKPSSWLPLWKVFTEVATTRSDFSGKKPEEFNHWKTVLEHLGGSLLAREPLAGDKADPKKMMEQRRRLFTNLCQAMLNEPSLAKLGFANLARLEKRDHLAGHGEAFALVDLAKKALATQSRDQNIVLRVCPSYSSLFSLSLRSPGQYLVEAAFAHNDHDLLNTLLSGKLHSDNTPPSDLVYLKSYSDLFFCKLADFNRQAKKLQHSQALLKGYDRSACEFDILTAWRARKDYTDIQQTISPKLTLDSNQFPAWYLYQDIGKTKSYLEGLAEKGEFETLRSFIGDKLEKNIGNTEEQVKIIKQQLSNKQGFASHLNALPFYETLGFLSVLDQFAERPLLTPEIIKLNQRLDSFYLTTSASKLFKQLESDEGIHNATVITTLLENPYFMSQVSKFDPLPLTYRKNKVTLFDQIATFLTLCNAQKREDVVSYLEKRKPSTFGADLMLALVADTDSEQKVAALMARHAVEIRSIPEEKQFALGKVFENLALGFDHKKGNPAGWKLIDELRIPLPSPQLPDLITRINSANTFSELKLSGIELSQQLVPALQTTITVNPELAASTLVKIWKLVDDAQKSGDRNVTYANASEFIRSFWRNVIRLRDPSLNLFPFLLDVSQDEILGKHILISRYDLRNAGEQFERIMKKKGSDKIKAFEKTFNELGEICADRPVELTSVMMFNFYHELKGHYTSVIRFLELERASGTYPKLAEAIMMGMEQHHSTHRWTGTKKGDDRQLTEVKRWYLAQLRDKSLPLRWRVLLATDGLYHEHEMMIAPEAAHAAAQVLVACFENNLNLGNEEFKHICLAFARAQKQQNWQTLAEAIIKKWNQVTTSRTARSNMRSQGNLFLSPDTSTLLAMLELTLHTGNPANTDRLLLKHSKKLQNEPSAIFTLARNGRPQLAASFLKLHWRNLNSKHLYTWHDGHPLTDAPRAALAAGAGSSEIALLAEVLIAAAPDSRKTEQNNNRNPMPALEPLEQDQEQRLAALARRFKKTSFDSKEARYLTLEWLTGNSISAAALLEPDIAELAKKTIDPAVLIKSGGSARRKMWLAYGHIAGSTSRGDLAPFGYYLGKINHSEKKGNTRWWLHWETFQAFQKSLPKAWPDHPAKIGKQMIPILQDYLESDDLFNRWDNSLSVGLLLACHAWMGNMESFDQWWQNLPAAKEKILLDDCRDVRKFGLALKFLLDYKNNKNTPIDKRIAVIETVMNSSQFKHSYQNSPNWFRYLSSNGILTPAQVIKYGKPWMKSYPRKGRAVAEYAIILAQLDRLDEALALIDLENEKITETPPENPIVWQAHLILGKVEALLEAKQYPQALTALQKFPAKTSNNLANQRWQLEKQIKKAAKPQASQ
ncbi:MAG: tetratricopeptide repeat protein [Verrucomicrobiales bacterium]|nr:tetratricopeptide repeat protein [Verrucomicrobiales bacterium]